MIQAFNEALHNGAYRPGLQITRHGLTGGVAKRHPSKPAHQDDEAQKENVHEAAPAIDASQAVIGSLS